ncbi:MAG: hypothetical protein EHM34_00225 [Nitrosopumilales archaeon]|nr:MAG: hypothetical protein EHM34_00225 [Nitrosopumilales archaeon]
MEYEICQQRSRSENNYHGGFNMKVNNVHEFLGVRKFVEEIAEEICLEHEELLWFNDLPLPKNILKIMSILMQELIE